MVGVAERRGMMIRDIGSKRLGRVLSCGRWYGCELYDAQKSLGSDAVYAKAVWQLKSGIIRFAIVPVYDCALDREYVIQKARSAWCEARVNRPCTASAMKRIYRRLVNQPCAIGVVAL